MKLLQAIEHSIVRIGFSKLYLFFDDAADPAIAAVERMQKASIIPICSFLSGSTRRGIVVGGVGRASWR